MVPDVSAADGDRPVDIGVRGLAVTFGQPRSVLAGVDVTVRRGEFVALIGASGCGKTTLLNVIAGLVPAAGGTVTIAGTPPAAGRRDICYVLARDALLPWRTVMGNVEYGLELSGIGREERARRAASYLNRVGLAHPRDLYPSRLSPRMRPRMSLARAFAVGPSLYLMYD